MLIFDVFLIYEDHSRDVKDRRSTDLLLKGLYLQSYEDSLLNASDNNNNNVPTEPTTTTISPDYDNNPTTRITYSRALPHETNAEPTAISAPTQTDTKAPFLIYVV